MTEKIPDPLVPPEVDLNGLEFMPMKHLKVLQSTLFVKSTGDEFKAAFALWCVSWTEVPAGSLPNDEVMLESFSRSKVWPKVRDRALHRWVLCSDGRLYHPVIAELALDAWEHRDEFREKQENKEDRRDRYRARVKELSEELRQLGVVPPRNVSLKKLEAALEARRADIAASKQASTQASPQASAPSPQASPQVSCADAVGMPLTVEVEAEGTAEVQVEGVPDSEADASGGAAPPPSGPAQPNLLPPPPPDSGLQPPDPVDTIFAVGLPMLLSANVPERNARSFLGHLRKIAKDQGGDAAIVAAINRCAAQTAVQPVEFLQACFAKKGGGGADQKAQLAEGMKSRLGLTAKGVRT